MRERERDKEFGCVCFDFVFYREEFDKHDLSESTSLLNQLVYTNDNRKVCLMRKKQIKLKLN